MSEYKIRKAKLEDAPFITEAILAAEKGMSDNLSYSTLFKLSESEVRGLIMNMLEEEIDGCEFSISSYYVTEFEGEVVATVGGWVEGLEDGMSSKILKSNLMTFTFPRENIKYMIEKSDLIKGILIEREPNTLQVEYSFVSSDHRGKNLIGPMQDLMEKEAMEAYPPLKKVHIQTFGNSVYAIGLLKRLGYTQIKMVEVDNDEILKYLPYKSKLLMEKIIN